MENTFYVLKVDDSEDNVRMSEFVMKQIKSFKLGRAFYELSLDDKDTLLHYKEVVYVQKEVCY